MKMNLFSSFDFYSGSNFILFNLIILNLVFFFPMKFWYFNSRYLYIVMNIVFFLKKEFLLLMGKKLYGGVLIYITFFLYILQFNIFGMFPYSFTLTSQLNMNLYFSLVFFFVFFLMGWIKFSNNMFSHLTPSGSPNILSPILVMIEMISMIIRPMTLSIRLTANIVSGHILMEILLSPAENMMLLSKLMIYIIMIPIFLLEMMVCFVQSFVISSLSTLYLSEPLSH
uniref:ATP synthase F0 subunit 6 n=1 Tax=Pseudophilothrips ichini TaxID=754119 RepID=UPI0028FCB970|nr:ATP synthase F0 subunit 6 [Pseudophilothrips ichini]WND64420.1 ATP synthase F0 subunit 6 [Pseudophilothrips ichini]